MLFYLKKFISFFVEPFGLTLLVFAIGLFFLYKEDYKKAKKFLAGAFTLLFLFSYPPFSNMLITHLENSYPKFTHINEEISYIHVLGSGNNDDYAQPLSSMLGDSSMKRVIEGVLIQKANPKAKLIFTGYEGSTTLANAVVNTRLAKALGVPTESIITNSQPKDTREEAEFTKTIVGDKSFVLVTSASHMLRAMKLFESLGMHPIAAPTDYCKFKNSSLFLAPNVGAFTTSQRAVHEYLGILWAKMTH